MASVKLYFFDARGRSEVIKLLLEAAKVSYENVLFDWDTWPNFQKDMPFGKCPVLEVDGKKLGQTMAICLYLAEKYGFNGSSLEDRLVINQALTLREEVMVEQIVPYVARFEPDVQKAKNKVLYGEKFPRFLGFFERMIKENSKGKDFVLGEKFSAADCAIFAATTTLEQERPELLAQYPLVAALRKRIAQVDGIKQHVESRKVTGI